MPLQLGCEDILRPQGLHNCKERTSVAVIDVAAVSCTESSQDQLSQFVKDGRRAHGSLSLIAELLAIGRCWEWLIFFAFEPTVDPTRL